MTNRHDSARRAYIENEFCIFFAAIRNAELHAEADLPPDVLPGSGAIIPIAHRTSPIDLTADEWTATHDLLVMAREALHELLAPDGYILGWNDMASLHAHLHVIPRFDDEPMWHQGVRSAIKIPETDVQTRGALGVAGRHRLIEGPEPGPGSLGRVVGHSIRDHSAQ